MDRERDYIIIKYRQFNKTLYSHIYLIKLNEREYLFVDLWRGSNVFRKIMSKKILKRIAKDGCSSTPNILVCPLHKGGDLGGLRFYGEETERLIRWVEKKIEV